MPSKYPKSKPIKLAALIPRQKKPAKPVAAPPKTSCAGSNEIKSPQQGYSMLRELLKNTAPRNIPKDVRKYFKDYSQNAITGMIRETSDAIKSAQGTSYPDLEITLKALENLLEEKKRGGK